MEYTDFATGKTITREQYIANGLSRGELVIKEECGCVVIQDRIADAYIVYCDKHATATELYEALVALVDYLTYMGVPEDCEDKYHEAQQTLAKAEVKP